MRRACLLLPLVLASVAACASILGIGDTVQGVTADATPADAPPGAPVKITVLRGVSTSIGELRQPINGATVVYGEAGGRVLAVATTPPTGKSSGSVAAGGMVTAAARFSCGAGELHALFTFYAVEPGDDLTAVLEDTLCTGYVPPPPTNSLATLPGTYGAATQYSWSVGCGPQTPPSPTGTLVLAYQAPCAFDASGRINALFIATGTAGEVGFSSSKLITAGAPFTFGPWSPAGTYTVTFSNVPTAPGELVATNVQSVIGGSSYDLQFKNQVTPNVSSFSVTIPLGFADSFLLTAAREIVGASSAINSMYATRQSQTTANVDLAAFLPHIHDPLTDVSDPLRPRLSWTADGPIVADGAELLAAWDSPSDASAAHHTFGAVVPAQGEVIFPALPDSLADYRPTPNVTISMRRVEVVRSTALGSYAAFRAGHLSYAGGAYLQPAVAPAWPYTTLVTSFQAGP